RDTSRLGKRDCCYWLLGGGEHICLASRQVVCHAAGEHALLDVGVACAAGGARERDHVQVRGHDARPGIGGEQLRQGLALRGREGVHVNEGFDLRVAGGGVGDDGPAVGVPHQHDGTGDAVQEVGQVGGVVGQAP